MKKIPEFKNAEEERRFWDESDCLDYAAWAKEQPAAAPDRIAPRSNHSSIPEKARKQAQSAGLTASDIIRSAREIRR